MDWLGGTIAHLLGLSGRLGASVALTAGALYIFRSRGIEPFTTIPPDWANGVFIAGLWGTALAAVSFVVWSAELVRRCLSAGTARWKARAIRAKRRKLAIAHISTGPEEFRTTLAYLYLNKRRRFSAGRGNTLLAELVQAGILETDDPPDAEYNRHAVYLIPDNIWAILKEQPWLKTLPVSREPPWNEFEPGAWRV
jgi:hypothetical protein